MSAGTRIAMIATLAAILSAPMPALAGEPVWRHATSLIGEPKYPADFKHFDWVNPNAPKGGAVTLGAFGSFDTLNWFPPGANAAAGLPLLYDQLMSDSLDEPTVAYGLIAESISYPDDFSSVTFRLRPEARFHDGQPVTPEDVIWSLDAQKKADPGIAYYYQNCTTVEKTGERDVTFRFNVTGNREMPHIMGQLVVLPKHFWSATGKDGKPRDLAKPIKEPPVGSGPYRITKVDLGRSIILERVADYWAKDLPVNVGHYNIDRIRYQYYLDNIALFEAFKSGEIEYRAETSSKFWATSYSFPAIKSGAVKKEEITLKAPEALQAFLLNLRRSKFADARVRRALNLAFDFEWSNKNLFYSQYVRTPSYFANTELASRGLPEGRELEILTELKDQVPPEVFTTEFQNPVNATQADLRKHLREADELLKTAGWVFEDAKRINGATKEPLKIEFLLDDEFFERIIQPYIANLKRLGIEATIRVIDSAQFEKRVSSFDFDVLVGGWAQSYSPGNEQRDYFSSAAADKPGSRNFAGIKNAAVDALIDKVIFAKDRAELVAAAHALDRVLLWNHYVVPHWHAPYERVAYWDRFRRPEKGPTQSVGFPTIWWFDPEASAAVDAKKKS